MNKIKNKFHFFTLLFSFLFLFSSCHEEDPCPTCFIKIVRCKVNGQDWVSNCISNDPLFGCSSVRCYYSYNEKKGLDFSAVNDMNNSGIGLDQFSAWGGAQLGSNSIQQRELGFSNFTLPGNCVALDSLDFSYNNYFILDKIDTVNFILEGKFGFRSYNLCGDTVTITDGYFKTKFIF